MNDPLVTRNCEHCSHGLDVESWEYAEPGCADTEHSVKGLPGYDPRNTDYYPGPDCPLRTIAKLATLLKRTQGAWHKAFGKFGPEHVAEINLDEEIEDALDKVRYEDTGND